MAIKGNSGNLEYTVEGESFAGLKFHGFELCRESFPVKIFYVTIDSTGTYNV